MTQAAPKMPRSPAAPKAARTIAIASGKGGVGKTWLAITLAQALALAGRRTLLFDGDLGLANVDIQLGINPGRNLGDVLAGRASLAAVAKGHEAGSFDIIAGRSGSGSLANLAPQRLRDLIDGLNGLAAGYDEIILDLGAGIERTVRTLASGCTTCLVVTTDEPTAITDAYAFLKLGYQANRDADLRVAVNMAASRRDGERSFATLRKACDTFLNTRPTLAGVVRHDSKVKAAIRHQTPLLTRHPNCKAAHDVVSLTQGLFA
jgi:flagellar biosynthesis protein FlhG